MRRAVFLCTILVVVGGFVLWSFQGTAHAQSRIANRLLDPPQPFCSQAPDDFDCTGYDPGDPSQGCKSDAYSVPFANHPNGQMPIFDDGGNQIGYVELRYSPSCQSNWARTTVTIPLSQQGVYPQLSFGATITRQATKALPSATYNDGTDTSQFTAVYTLMVFAPNSPAQACGGIGRIGPICTPFI